jgi:DNA polymerase-1
MAHMANEPKMIKAFKKIGVDFHQIKANDLSVDRSAGKTLNFAMVYNVGADTLSTRLKTTEAEAKKLLDKEAQTYKAVAKWKQGQIAFAEKEGYVRTILGRRCYITHKKYAGTTAVNYPIQGSAADLLKLAMIKIAEHIHRMGFQAKMVNQVHDELVIDCPENEIKLLVPYVKEVFEHPKWGEEYIKLRCPLEADIFVVDNWGEAKD